MRLLTFPECLSLAYTGPWSFNKKTLIARTSVFL